MNTTLLRTLLRHAGATVAASAVLLAGVPRVDAQISGFDPYDGGSASLLSDCDISVQSCGTDGGELYAGGTSGGTNSSGTTYVCAQGQRTVCNVTSVKTCTSWRITTVSGDASVQDLSGLQLSGSFKLSCETWLTTTMEFRWV